MKQLIKKIIKNPLFAGSAVMIIGSNITNVLNYLYHLIMGRLLGPANYGELASLFSLILLLTIIPTSLSLVIVKYVSSARNNDEINSLITWLNRKMLVVTLVLFTLVVLTSPLIASFLQINNITSVILVALMFAFILPTILNRAVLQGTLHFNQYVIALFTENSIKLIGGILLVYFGFSVGGALTGLIIAVFLTWLLTKRYLKQFLNSQAHHPINPPKNIKQMSFYAIPVIFQSLAITSFYSTDVILVKHFFTPHQAGIYAALSTLGKIIFFSSGPIASVMFPMISGRSARGQSYRKIFIYSLFSTVFLSLGILSIYWLIPGLAIKILFGTSYLEAASLLIWFGIFVSLFTASSLFINYYLSLHKTKIVILPIVAAFAQGLGIWFFHNSLQTVITISIITSMFMLIGLLLYFVLSSSKISTAKNE